MKAFRNVQFSCFPECRPEFSTPFRRLWGEIFVNKNRWHSRGFKQIFSPFPNSICVHSWNKSYQYRPWARKMMLWLAICCCFIIVAGRRKVIPLFANSMNSVVAFCVLRNSFSSRALILVHALSIDLTTSLSSLLIAEISCLKSRFKAASSFSIFVKPSSILVWMLVSFSRILSSSSAVELKPRARFFSVPSYPTSISAMYVVCGLYVVTSGMWVRSSLFSLISKHCSWLLRSTFRVSSSTSSLL